MTRWIAVALLALTGAACGQLMPGPQGDALRACLKAYTSQQCSCVQGVLSDEHFIILGDVIEAQTGPGTEQEKASRAQYVLMEATNGDFGQIMAVGQGMATAQQQCGID